MKIGIAGTGRMGEAIGLRLISLGHELTVWNRTPEKTKALAAAGAHVVPSAAAVTTAAQVVLTILTDDQAIEALYNGPQGLLSGAATGKLFIEMSTVCPEVEIALPEVDRIRIESTVRIAPEAKVVFFSLPGSLRDIAVIARARPVDESEGVK